MEGCAISDRTSRSIGLSRSGCLATVDASSITASIINNVGVFTAMLSLTASSMTCSSCTSNMADVRFVKSRSKPLLVSVATLCTSMILLSIACILRGVKVSTESRVRGIIP